jgi:hypothetical protein
VLSADTHNFGKYPQSLEEIAPIIRFGENPLVDLGDS